MSKLQLTSADVNRLLRRLGGDACTFADGKATYAVPGLQVTASGLEVRGAVRVSAGALELHATGISLAADGASVDFELGM